MAICPGLVNASLPINNPPIKGPTIKPSPKPAPISPNVLVLFSGVEMSANTAVAVAAVPPLIPSIIRAPKSRNRGILAQSFKG